MTPACSRLAAALIASLAVTGAAQAATLITTFDSFTFNGHYGSWSNPATRTSGASSFTVAATGFGGGFKDIQPNVDATGETTVEFDVTVNTGPAGVVLVLADDDGTQYNYGWFGREAGSYLLTMDVLTPSWVSADGNTAGLDLATLSFIHVQVDPGTNTGPYSVSFNNLQLIPEPATLALAAVGGGAMLLRRRAV